MSVDPLPHVLYIGMIITNLRDPVLPPPPSPAASSPTRYKQLHILVEGSEAQTKRQSGKESLILKVKSH